MGETVVNTRDFNELTPDEQQVKREQFQEMAHKIATTYSEAQERQMTSMSQVLITLANATSKAMANINLSAIIEQLRFSIGSLFNESYFSNIASSVRVFAERLSDLAIPIRFGIIIEEIGWPPLALFASREFQQEIVDLCSDCEKGSFPKEEIERLIVEIFDSEMLDLIYENWESGVGIKRERLPILKEAIEAHKAGMYYCSVSLLMCQLPANGRNVKKELETFEIPTPEERQEVFDKYNIKKEASDKAIIAELELYAASLVCLDTIEYIVKNIYLSGSNEKQTPVNRHGICHGEYCEFGTVENSLKTIICTASMLFLGEDYIETSKELSAEVTA